MMNTCAACHGRMVRKTGITDLRISGNLCAVKNVSYDACEICGEKVVSPDVSRKIYETVKNREYIEEMITVPILNFA